jgi:hypothetical protein
MCGGGRQSRLARARESQGRPQQTSMVEEFTMLSQKLLKSFSLRADGRKKGARSRTPRGQSAAAYVGVLKMRVACIPENG